MLVTLERFSYSPTETEGVMLAGGLELFTIERPWMPSKTGIGGEPFISCIPEGVYQLTAFSSSRHKDAWMLANHSLGVYRTPSDIPVNYKRRYGILIHSANFANQLEGCIAPGITRTIFNEKRAVGSSSKALSELNKVLDRSRPHILHVRQHRGAYE